MSQQAILSMFCNHRIGLRGTVQACNLTDQLLQKWDRISTQIQVIFDDGLIHGDHCMSLYIQNDRHVWEAIQALFLKTHAQGKTEKTWRKKTNYFHHHFDKIMGANSHHLLKVDRDAEKEDGVKYEDRLTYTEALWQWWFNYYLGACEVPQFPRQVLYPIDREMVEIIERAELFERQLVTAEPAPQQVSCTRRAFDLAARHKSVTVGYHWDDLAFGVVYGLIESFKSYHKNGKRLRAIVGDATIDVMDTPNAMNGMENNWFYIYVTWPADKFRWATMQEVETKMAAFMAEVMRDRKFKAPEQNG